MPHDSTYLKIHLAAYYNGRANIFEIPDYPYILESYHYIGHKEKMHQRILQDAPRKIFLDSGAFSMFTQGVEIPLEEYADYVRTHQDIVDVASVMDGIGDPQKTYENQLLLEDMGISVLPCFHYGEDTRYLEYYLARYKHITLGGMVPISTPELYKWLDFIWENFLTDAQGYPTHKVHGFGLTVTDLMKRYPWYSVDSTSWVLTGSFGAIFARTDEGREFRLAISEHSPTRHTQDKHFDNLSPIDKKTVGDLIESRGHSVEELRTVYWKRDLWNIQYFKELCDLPMKPFIPQEQGLFNAW